MIYFLDVNQRISFSITTIRARNLQQVRELLTPQIKLATFITTFMTCYADSALLTVTYQIVHEINWKFYFLNMISSHMLEQEESTNTIGYYRWSLRKKDSERPHAFRAPCCLPELETHCCPRTHAPPWTGAENVTLRRHFILPLLKKERVQNNGHFTHRASVLWSSVLKLFCFVWSNANDKKTNSFLVYGQ